MKIIVDIKHMQKHKGREVKMPETNFDKTEHEVVLTCKDLCKCYGGVVHASKHVDFDLRRGEVHAFLGENGAGKSTLMKMLYGIEQPDEGKIYINGKEIVLSSSAVAIANGIGMVHQELMLIPHLTVVENIILGQETKTKVGTLNLRAAHKEIKNLADAYGLEIDLNALVEKLSIGQRQRVEIIKLLYRKADILILDEPTALLTPQESDALFEVLRRLKEMGKSIIFITHKLREVYQIADRMTVIRSGKIVGVTTPQETNVAELAQMMVGKTVSGSRRTPHPIGSNIVLDVKNVNVLGFDNIKVVDDVSFSVRAGEVLGVAGIEGNGQTQLAQAILGLLKTKSGSIYLEGKEISRQSTKKIRKAGVGSIPDDRQGMGLILSMRIFENMVLNEYDEKPFAKNPVYEDWGCIKEYAREKIEDYSIATANESVYVSALSGGNQQKIVVARELTKDCKLLIAAQPTRGVDIASAYYIHSRILQAAEEGCAVVMISSDLDELIRVSDRIMVMFRGKVMGFVDGDAATREGLGRMMLGESDGESI